MKKPVVERILAAVVVFVLLGFTQQSSSRFFEISKNLEIYSAIFKQVNEYYVDEINPDLLMRAGIDSILASLDPYTRYISEDQVEDFRTESTGQYAGIGTQTRRVGKKTVVTNILEGYPAHKGGLLVGDEIISVNGIPIKGLPDDEITLLLKGQVKTNLELSIMRFGSETPLNLTFTREKVKLFSVPSSSMVSPVTGYLKLSEFTMQSSREVKKAIEALKANGAESLILDLRNNPGGLLIEAVNICNLFIDKGLEVVSTKGNSPAENMSFKTVNSPFDTAIPLVILLSKGSASASEVVSGTLQDYDRAVIMGEKSYGKGLVQVSRPLSYNSQLKVTTAKYYVPSGRCIQVLDYSNRNPDGSAGIVADSLKKAFKTSNGRVVYDGGGIDPDIAIQPVEVPAILEAMVNNLLIFDYATLYYHTHQTIPEPTEFSLSKDDFEEFKSWLQDKSLNYDTELELLLKKLKESTNTEKASTLQTSIDKLQKMIAAKKVNDLDEYRTLIKKSLEFEIISRYYFESGALQASLSSDEAILRAVELLKNKSSYYKILGSD